MSSSNTRLSSKGGEQVFPRGQIQFCDFAKQSALIEKLASDFQSGQFVHAYLFSGAEGVGKRSLASLCIQALYCSAEEKPCGDCTGCKRVAGGNLTDVHLVQPDGASLKVEQIRELIETMQMRPFEGGVKVAIISQAHKMTVQAQNSLLKTLENPPGDAVFFLLTETVSAILPTIRSRCQGVTLRPLDPDTMIRRLVALGIEDIQARALAGMTSGSMGRALSLAADQTQRESRRDVLQQFFGIRAVPDVVEAAARYKAERAKADEALCIVQEAAAAALRWRVTGEQPDASAYPTGWWEWGKRVSVRHILRLFERLTTCRKMLFSNVQTQMVLETVLLEILEENKS